MTAIVCGCWYNGLNIIQELGRKGVGVYAVDTFRNIGTLSRYATYHGVPDPKQNGRIVVDELLQLAKQIEDEPVVIPTGDEWALLLSQFRSRLSQSMQLCVSEQEVVELLLNKDQFGSWAQNKDYPVPRTFSPKYLDKIPTEAYPVAAKPRDPNNDDIDFRLEVLNNESKAREFISQSENNSSEIVLQEYVRGMSDSMYTVGVYATGGEILGLFTGRKVRGYPPDIGDCKVGQVQSVPEHIISTVKEMCADLGYDGIAEFEFKRDEKSGDFYLIEVNPRSWSWVGITPACGVNLPWIAYRDLQPSTETKIENPPVHTTSLEDGKVKWVKVFEDLPNTVVLYYFTHRSWHMGPFDWWHSLQCDSLVTSDISKDDPLPTIISPALYLVRYGLKAADKFSETFSRR